MNKAIERKKLDFHIASNRSSLGLSALLASAVAYVVSYPLGKNVILFSNIFAAILFAYTVNIWYTFYHEFKLREALKDGRSTSSKLNFTFDVIQNILFTLIAIWFIISLLGVYV